MKLLILFLLVAIHLPLTSQTWVDCNEMILTVDDFNTDLDFENQPADCGCTNAGGECTLVRIKMVETINGIETPVSYSRINFSNPITPPLEPNYSFRDYIDIYNPYSTCTEYQSQGQLNHTYNFSPVAPPGHELHLLVCPGSEQGQMRGRFFSLSPGTPLAAPTNVQASDGQSGISVTFDSQPGKYYMAFRSTENCNQSWTPIDPSSNWPQATSTTMTLTPNSFIPDQQFEYRVVCSENSFVVASGTDGAWSDGDLGHYGSLTLPYTAANDCSAVMGDDCINDTEDPSCNGDTFTVQLDAGQDYYSFDINDFSSDNCTDVLIYENAYLDPSTPNGNSPFDEISMGSNDQFACGTYIITNSSIFDDLGNFNDCAFTYVVECGGTTPGGDTCTVEPTFSNLLWSSYLGGDGEDEVVDIYVDESSGTQYVLGRTNSTNFYSTNPEIGTASTGFKTFVMAINPDASLLWSTLINGWDDPQAIHMDPDGYLTLVGITDKPTLPGPTGLPGYDKDHNGGKDILILKMDDLGQNIHYSSFYGGAGNETYNGDPMTPFTFTKERLKVDFRDNHIYVLGTTDSNDLPLQSAIDINPGDGFSFVLEASTSSSTLYFASYIKKISGAITPLVDGGFAIVVENADGDYGNLISPNAIESGYDAFFPLPILMVFDNNNMVEYATYIGPHRVQGQSQICDNSASNGTPGNSNLYDFQLKSDDCGNLYWYSLGNGFRQPILSSEYLLPARKYRPSLEQLQDSCNMSVNNPLLKINLIDEADPFIEYMLFFGYNGRSSATSSFAIDNNQRPHFHTRKEAFFTDPDISLPVGNDFTSDVYFIFENDLTDVQVLQNSPGTDLLPVGIKVFDNKAYLIGSMSDALGSVTPSWTDEDGNTNSIIQSSYGSGTNDGFISVIDNNELCGGCNQPADTTQCENVVLNFDGIDDKVTLTSPLSGNSDFTISMDFNWSGISNGSYNRLIGWTDFELEIAIRPTGEISYFDGGWVNTGAFIQNSQWYNVTLRRDGSQFSMFLDGVNISERMGATNLNFGGELTLGGKYNNNAELFSGSIDNLRVFALALTDSDIASNFSFPSSPLTMYFNFEEGDPSGDNTGINGVQDVLGIYLGELNGFSLSGNASNYICDEYEIVFPTSCDNQVMHFTDAKEYIRLENAGTQSDFTVGAWFKLSDQSNGGNEDRIIAFGPTNRLEIGTTNIGQFWRYDPNSIVQNERIYANTSLRDGEWHHFAYVASGTERIIYLDFQEIDQYQTSSQVYGPSFHVGRWTGGGSANSQFSGEIDEVRGYDIAIDSSTICETFSQVPAFNSSNLSIYFDFEEGVPGGDNSSLIQAVNNGYLSDGDLINFNLLDSMSNYICDPINFEGCDDPCEDDTEPPVATCSGNIIEVELGLDGTIALTEDMFDFSATDNCNFSIEFEGGVLDCDDIGQTLFAVVDVIDDAGLTDQCFLGVMATDPNGYCEMDTMGCSPYIVCELDDIQSDSCSIILNDYTDGVAVFDSCCISNWDRIPVANSNHSLIIKQNKSLWGWGNNERGQLGTGNTQLQPRDVLISCEEWIEVAVGGGHSLAIKSDGTLWASGLNSNGQLGNNSTTNSNVFVSVGTDTNWNKVFAHGASSFAIKEDGSLWAWGRNFRSILGLGDDVDRNIPTRVGLDNDWAFVSKGTMALKDDGSLWGWGYNGTGNLLQTTLGATISSPSPIFPTESFNDLASNNIFAYLIKLDGSLWCYGVNTDGQLATGGTSISESFRQVGLDNDWVNVEVGSKHVNCLKGDGKVYSAGRGVVGSIGQGLQVDAYTLTESLISDVVVDISTSSEGAFCLTTDNDLITFGGNGFGASLGIDMQIGAYATPLPVVLQTEPFDVTSDYSITQVPSVGSVITSDDLVTLYVVDSGLQILDSCSFNIKLCDDPCISDITNPICITQNINLSLDQNGQATLTPDIIDNGSFDECSEVTLAIDLSVFNCSNIGDNTVMLTVTDASGNTSSCPAVVTIEDKQQPSCSTMDITVNLDVSGVVSIQPTDIDNGSADNCSISLSIDISTFTCDDVGENVVSLTVTDQSGNTNQCTALVIVEDSNDYCDPTCIFSCTAECSTDNVNLSTGIESVTENFLSVGDYDANWTLIGSPDPGIQVPRAAFVLNPNTVWDQLPGSQYISAYPDANNNATNINDNTFYEFEKCFCVCDDVSEVSIDLAAYVDNNLEILLFNSDGTEIQSLLNITDQTAGAFTGDPEITMTTLSLDNGIYCLRARLKNDGSETMGMSIEANVSGIGLIENQCCKSFNAITGSVFQDVACDGIYNISNDFAIEDWEVQLCAGSTVLETITTDGFGYYSFNNIAPGDYTVKALNPDMNQSSTSVEVTVSILDNEVVPLDFGFCDVDVCCFDNDIFMNFVNEGVRMYRIDCDVIIGVPLEYNDCFETIVDWGDGSQNTFFGPSGTEHQYSSNGEYEICIETVQRDSDGNICNTSSECRSICMTCDQECLDDYLYAVESYHYPDFNTLGYINKVSDVFLDDTGLYAAYSKVYNNGSTDILIYKDGILAHTMSNTIGTQVSEIQVHDNYIYLTGSFEGGDMLVTSSDGNNVILNNNCYQPGACLSDGFVIRFNMGFTLDWAFRLGQTWIDDVEDITVISESEFAITGTTRLDADFDPNQGLETLAEPTHTVKSYIAKYTFDGSQALPVCDWVNTLYTQDAAVSNAFGLGVTHDDVGSIYATGGYSSSLAYGNTSPMDLYTSTTNTSLNSLAIPIGGDFTVPAEKIFGYVVKYDAIGDLYWANSLNNMGTGSFRNNYGSDIEILNDAVFVGGLNTVAKYQLNGMLDPSLSINPIIENGIDISEIAVGNDMVYLMGFVNDTYRNLQLQLSPGQGLQITSPLNFIFSVYDQNLGYIKSLNPGGNGVDYGQGISVNGDQVAICGSTASDVFLSDHPRMTPLNHQLSILSDRDFYVGLYECNCGQFDEGKGGCCDGLTAQLKDDPVSDYCCSISISNSQEFDISYITIDIDPTSTSVFESGQIELNGDFIVLSSTATSLDIGHISGTIPQGPISSLVDFCLFNDNHSATGPIEYTISYIQVVNQQEQVACQDIVTGDCDQGELSSCASIANVSILCSEEKESYYEIILNVDNESGNAIDQLQLSGLPSGMSWSPCDIDPPIINTELDVSLDALQPGESIDVCVRIYTNSPVTMVTNLFYEASFLDADGKTFCTITEQELELIPCCDPCDDLNIMIAELSECCYSLTMSGFCNSNDFDELNISAPDGVSIVNSNVTQISVPNQVWFLCDTGTEDLCIAPAQGLFADQVGAVEVTFCLSGNADESQELVFDFINDKSDILCSKTETVNCNGGCVPEGFNDPSLVTIGLVDQKFRLECDQPPLILDCPTFSEVFIKGRFDCSDKCDAIVSTSVLLNGVEIKPKSSEAKDETWEIYLTDLIKNPGLYQIIVEGECDGNKQQCTYSFEVREDCFDCTCSKLNDDISYLFSINNFDGCQIGISPNGLLECDEVASYSFNANLLDGPFLYNEEVVFNIPQSGMYVICMKVKRNGEDADCEDQICKTYNLTCSSDGINGLFCEIPSIKNGDFSQGVQGSLHDNSNSFLPGWELQKGEGYFFENGGSGNENSGFIRLKKISFDDAFCTSRIVNPGIEKGESNIVRVFHDVKSLSDSAAYSIAVVTENDTIIITEQVYHENIWVSKMIAFPVNNEMMNSIESGEAEIGLLSCQINCEIESSDDDTVIDFDNVCIEIEKKTVGTENQVSDENIMIYPNPNRGQFHIEFEDPNQYLNITILDVVGRVIYENASLKKLMKLNIESYSSGVYILKAKTLKGEYQNLKFIKIR